MAAQFHDLRCRLITKAEICHARHPNQCLFAWAVGSFLVSQIMVGGGCRAPAGAVLAGCVADDRRLLRPEWRRTVASLLQSLEPPWRVRGP